MKYYLKFFVSIFIISFIAGCDNMPPGKDNIDEKANRLLEQMTLEEKVGQMTQITLLEITKERENDSDPLVIDEKKLKEAMSKYHIGSFFDNGGAANSIENWHEIITKIQDASKNNTRLNIPVMYGIDAIHGVNYTLGATIFPQSIALAASRNRELVRKGAEITAAETRASGIPWNFNPVLGMGRNPYWSRFFETFGEDVYLTSELGREYIEGSQNSSLGKEYSVAACMKHFLGYSFPLNGKDRTPALIPDRTLREIFLPPYEEAVKAGVMTVMLNSSEINGIPVHSDYNILTVLLKNKMDFSGLVVSDWQDIIRLHTRDRVADTPEEAVRMAVMAGVDMSMVPNNYSFFEILVKLVNDGVVPVERINDAVRRILRVKLETGLFENPYPDKDLLKMFATEESEQINLEAARETITLLKNRDEILPLNKKKKVLITGPTADKLMVLNGGWTITWQGNREDLYPAEKKTVLEAIQDKIGRSNVIFSKGTDFDKEINIRSAVRKASGADYIIVCLGESPYCETPGNINDLSLEEAQIKLVSELKKTGKPVITVLLEGRPRVLKSAAEKSDAIIMAYLPGLEGGRAIADVIFGDYNPSGILPFSYPKYPAGFTCYDYKPIESYEQNQYEPLFPFGHGLSYTDFEYSDLTLSDTVLTGKGFLTVSVKVENTGDRQGKTAVELYLTDLYGSVSRPVKQLKRFEKISLESGEEKEVKFTVNQEDLKFIGRKNNWIAEPGEFIIEIKGLKKKFTFKSEK